MKQDASPQIPGALTRQMDLGVLLAEHMRPLSRGFKAKLPVERSGSQRLQRRRSK